MLWQAHWRTAAQSRGNKLRSATAQHLRKRHIPDSIYGSPRGMPQAQRKRSCPTHQGQGSMCGKKVLRAPCSSDKNHHPETLSIHPHLMQASITRICRYHSGQHFNFLTTKDCLKSSRHFPARFVIAKLIAKHLLTFCLTQKNRGMSLSCNPKNSPNQVISFGGTKNLRLSVYCADRTSIGSGVLPCPRHVGKPNNITLPGLKLTHPIHPVSRISTNTGYSSLALF